MKDTCCTNDNPSIQKKGFWQGLMYGILPHSFCIGFVVFSAIGAVTITTIFKKVMLVPYFLHILVLLSLVMATLSAVLYLRRCRCFNRQGIKSKWRYLTILYGTTILINFLMFFYVLPAMANIGFVDNNVESSLFSSLSLRADIPCVGHAPLVIDELTNKKGITNVKFEPPNIFNIKYDHNQISPDEIMSTDILKIFKARTNL
jgi:hypothetical protein